MQDTVYEKPRHARNIKVVGAYLRRCVVGTLNRTCLHVLAPSTVGYPPRCRASLDGWHGKA
jgi:hypothetical protein